VVYFIVALYSGQYRLQNGIYLFKAAGAVLRFLSAYRKVKCPEKQAVEISW